MSRTRVQLILLVVPALWGLVFVAVNEVLRELSAFQLVTIRFAMICVAFVAMFVGWRRVRTRFERSEWGLLAFAGLMAVPLSQLSIVYAQNFLSPTLASLMITTSPAVAAVLAPSLLGESIGRWQAAGFGLALLGAGAVIVVGAGQEASFEVENILGAAVGLITPVAWALYTIALKRLAATHPPLGGVGMTLLVGSVFMLPFVPTAIDGAGSAPAATWWWLVFLAFGGTFIPYVLWFWSLKYLDANQTSAYLYLVPVFALIWSLIVLREVPPLGALAGGLLVFAGVALTQSHIGRRQPELVP